MNFGKFLTLSGFSFTMGKETTLLMFQVYCEVQVRHCA